MRWMNVPAKYETVGNTSAQADVERVGSDCVKIVRHSSP